MPIYEYECDGCHSVFEVRQKVSDPAPTAHSCGSTEVRRILSATSFVLKGTGWYATDYGNRKDASADTSSSKEHKAKGDAQAGATAKTEPRTDKAAAKPASNDSTSTAASGQKAAKT